MLHKVELYCRAVIHKSIDSYVNRQSRTAAPWKQSVWSNEFFLHPQVYICRKQLLLSQRLLPLLKMGVDQC